MGRKKWLERLIAHGEVYFGCFAEYRNDTSKNYQERLLHSIYGREDERPDFRSTEMTR